MVCASLLGAAFGAWIKERTAEDGCLCSFGLALHQQRDDGASASIVAGVPARGGDAAAEFQASIPVVEQV